MSKWTIGKKITLGFGWMIAVALILGGTGYYSSLRSGRSVSTLGMQCLPAVQAVETIRIGGERVKTAQQALLNMDLDPEVRKHQYESIAKARADYDIAWKAYDSLEKTAEATTLWKELEITWGEWRKANTDFFAMIAQLEEFRLGNPLRLREGMEHYRGDHYQLVTRTLEMVRKNVTFDGGDDPTQCAFGKWKAEQKLQNSEIQRALSDIEEPHKQFHQAVKRVKELTRKGENQGGWKVCEEEIVPGSEQLVATFERMNKQAVLAEEIYLKAERQAYEVAQPLQIKANDLMDKLAKLNEDRAASEAEHAIAEAHSIKILTVSLTLLGLLLSGVLAVYTIRSTTIPIKTAAAALSSGAEQTACAASQVSSASQSLADGASEQAASLEETSSSLEEMASMTTRNSESAQRASNLAKQTRTAAEKGAADMQTMSASMQAIQESGNEISKIIKTIDEIAFQTNILALNAAVEAARAGEAGLGFAVVADEVRNLAHRSAEAAKETATKIENAIASTSQGVQMCNHVAHTLDEILTKVRQVDELVGDVASASKEQSQGIAQINIAVGQMDKVTQGCGTWNTGPKYSCNGIWK